MRTCAAGDFSMRGAGTMFAVLSSGASGWFALFVLTMALIICPVSLGRPLGAHHYLSRHPDLLPADASRDAPGAQPHTCGTALVRCGYRVRLR